MFPQYLLRKGVAHLAAMVKQVLGSLVPAVRPGQAQGLRKAAHSPLGLHSQPRPPTAMGASVALNCMRKVIAQWAGYFDLKPTAGLVEKLFEHLAVKASKLEPNLCIFCSTC